MRTILKGLLIIPPLLVGPGACDQTSTERPHEQRPAEQMKDTKTSPPAREEPKSANAPPYVAQADSTIVGTWEGYSQMFRDTATFVFAKDKTGRMSASSGNAFNTRYTLDTKVRPMTLDIVIDSQNGDMHAIVEFLSDNSMRIKMPAGNGASRPRAFSTPDDNETVLFKRVK